jgi:hypothetical protein
VFISGVFSILILATALSYVVDARCGRCFDYYVVSRCHGFLVNCVGGERSYIRSLHVL